MGVIKTPVDCDAESAGNTLRPAIYAIKNPTGLGGEYQVAPRQHYTQWHYDTQITTPY